jgi:hypothetical protein
MSRTIEASGERAGWRDAPVAVSPGRWVLPASALQVGVQLPGDLDPHLDQVLARPAQRRSAQRHQLRRWRASSCGSFLRQPRWRLPVAVLAWAAHSAGAAARAAAGASHCSAVLPEMVRLPPAARVIWTRRARAFGDAGMVTSRTPSA